MATAQPAGPLPPPLDESLAEARAIARDQLEAASQIQIGRLMDQLSAGWHADVQHIFDERLASLHSTLQAHHERSRRELFDRLNQSARRLRHFDTEEHWSRALVDATEGLCDRAMLFAVNLQSLEFRAARNLDAPAPAPIPLASAPAFSSAVETRDTVVALRTRGELSEPIVRLTGEAPESRSSLFPLVARQRVAAVLYADSNSGRLETSALELIATLGAAVIEGLPAGAARPTPLVSLNKNDHDLHLRAQRFARLQVAHMRLYQSQAVKDGRLHAGIYSYLKPEIDAGRAAFQRDFLSVSPSMVDYFHVELVQTLAHDDAALLGKEYPGPLLGQ